MYKDLFDDISQQEMRNYFINLANKIGKKKSYKKNELININTDRLVGIVTNGVISQSIVSDKGQLHILYLLRKGEIFGETFKFCGGTNKISSIAREDSQIAFIESNVLDTFLSTNPECYRYFIHSITRKYRIVTLQLIDSVFNDSTGKIADTLIRLSSCSEKHPLGKFAISMIFTHEELANDIGCSRATVTNCLNKFLDERIIHYENKKIVIDDIQALKKYINVIF